MLRLDPDTGAGVAIGGIGFTTNGLAVAADATIYAATTAGQLIRINPVKEPDAGGNFGGGLTSSGDLVFDWNDVLYGALDSAGTVVLARIDRTTGAATVIGPTGLNTVYGLGFYCCRLFGAPVPGSSWTSTSPLVRLPSSERTR